MDDRKIRIPAMAAIAFSAFHIIALLAVIAFPRLAIRLFAYDIDIEDVPVPITLYVYMAAFAFNILAMALVLNRKGFYAPLIICSVSAVLGAVITEAAGQIEPMIIATTTGLDQFVAYGSLNSMHSLLYLMTFAGFAISIPLSAAYAFLGKKGTHPEYRPPVVGWTAAAIVILILYMLSEIYLILSQKQLAAFFGSTSVDGFHISASSVILLLTAAAAIVCCVFLLKGKKVDPRIIFLIVMLYPIISRVISVVEFRTLSVELMAYYSSLGQFSTAGLCRLGVMICAAAAAVQAAETSTHDNIRQDHGFNID